MNISKMLLNKLKEFLEKKLGSYYLPVIIAVNLLMLFWSGSVMVAAVAALHNGNIKIWGVYSGIIAFSGLLVMNTLFLCTLAIKKRFYLQKKTERK
ncbi:MAG: hypothetical protein OXH57_05265 [Ekhidna sp.]|nr:hypothetical protein [Ekhidna sp.]